MIDWYSVLTNGLWILGLAVILAAFSYTDWRRGLNSPKTSLRQALASSRFLAVFSLGMVLFCAGLALTSGRWWEIAAWALLSVVFAWQGISSWQAWKKTDDA
ncbi:MAG: hypothetical protein U9R25_13130 [Chloroflexota bacterium]|nr:hypothetical protein [Chloroflexota bacterium]